MPLSLQISFFLYRKCHAIIFKNRVPAANTSSAELCSIATDDMTLSNELQNAIAAVSVVKPRVFSEVGNFKTKIRSRMKFRDSFFYKILM
jgi:hypothetical protein